MEVKSLTAQPRSLKPALELGKIVGAQHSRVFRHLGIVGIYLILSGFMSHDRNGRQLDGLLKIHNRVGRRVVKVTAFISIIEAE